VFNAQLLLILYLLDAMHCEKNLSENMTKIVLGMKDLFGSRQDMENLKIRRDLWLCPPQNRRADFHILGAPYSLNGAEKVNIMDIIRNLKTPTGYVGAIQKCLAEGKLSYMKLHDYHIMMHQVSH
jgi:hypothetical protein